jgi:hypothetical protein
MKTGPQKYPGASTTYWYQSRYGGTAMESNVGVIHTTEGRTLPSYGGGASAPNFTAVPDFANKRLRWYQHFDFDVSSRALMNRSGGVDTNTANAVQIELVGTCDERHASTWDGKRAGSDYVFWPDAPDWALADLGVFVKWAHDQHDVPLRSTVTWKPYNKGQVGGSYGANGVRLTGAQWNAYYGWLGHQHVPENDHGDPGNLDFARVLAHATGQTQPPEEIDVPLTSAEITKIADAVLKRDGVIVVPGAPTTNPTWTLSSVQTEILKRLDRVAATEAAQTAAITTLAGLVGKGVDTATVVTAVQQAIADAVIQVDVAVTNKESS